MKAAPSCFMDLPPELFFNILEELSYKDLLSCSMVCKALHDVVVASTPLQYKIELAAAGLEDNSEHPLSKQAKRPLLREYQDAWAQIPQLTARKSNSAVVSAADGPAWELAGGVLGQSVGLRKLRFHRLGSKLRGVTRHTWHIEVDYDVRDFTMDPGQDLLVTLKAPRYAGGLFSVSLLSMSSGRPHPLARKPDLSLPFSHADDFEIRVNGSLVGLLVMRAMHDGEEIWSPMRVWNWKTGQLILVDEQEYVCSFVWLSDKYILLAHMVPPEENGALSVIELTDDLDRKDTPVEDRPRWTFLFPRCRTDSAVIESMELLSDPGPRWTPATDLQSALSTAPPKDTDQARSAEDHSQPPFFIARDDRVIALMMTVMDERSPYLDPYTIRFTISTSKLLNFIHRDDPVSMSTFSWSVWGPQCTRAEPRNDIWDGSWPCCVYGTKIVAESSWVEHHDNKVTRYRPVDLNPPNHNIVMGTAEIYDFNQTALKYAVTQADPTLSSHAFSQESQEPVDYQDVKPLHIDGFDYYLQPTHLPPDFAKFFDDPDNVLTSLPYRVCRTNIATHREGSKETEEETDDPKVDVGTVTSVMLSEDSIVLIREWPEVETDPDFLVVEVR